jgi:hypothetical protein
MYAETKKKYYEKNKKQIMKNKKNGVKQTYTKYMKKILNILEQYYQDHKLEIRAKQKQIYLKKWNQHTRTNLYNTIWFI